MDEAAQIAQARAMAAAVKAKPAANKGLQLSLLIDLLTLALTKANSEVRLLLPVFARSQDQITCCSEQRLEALQQHIQAHAKLSCMLNLVPLINSFSISKQNECSFFCAWNDEALVSNYHIVNQTLNHSNMLHLRPSLHQGCCQRTEGVHAAVMQMLMQILLIHWLSCTWRITTQTKKGRR